MSGNHDELMRYARGEVAAPRDQRAQAAKAKALYDEVQLARLKVDGHMVLAQHIMDRAVRLDNERRLLAQDDPAVNLMLSEIEAIALRQARRIQGDLLSGW